MRTRAALAVLFIVIASSSQVLGENYWTSAANTCPAAEPSIQNDRYTHVVDSDMFNAYLSNLHKGTNVDQIQFYCPVIENIGATEPIQLNFTFKDESTTAGNFVQVQLNKVHKTTGALTEVDSANSDAWDGAATGIQYQGSTFSHDFDFDTYSYFVAVTMDRSSSAISPRFYQVSLDWFEEGLAKASPKLEPVKTQRAGRQSVRRSVASRRTRVSP